LLYEQRRPWNKAFTGGTIVTPDKGRLPMRRVGGMCFTILSPTVQTLVALRAKWRDAIESAGFRPGSSASALKQFAARRWAKKPKRLGDETSKKTLDHSIANGSSIAVIAEYQGVRLLLTADAYPTVLRESIERWRNEEPTIRGDKDGRVHFDAFKLAHHGSKKNMTPQLMDVISCPVYLVSTDGKRFGHPDMDTIRDVVAGHHGGVPIVDFNYRTPQTEAWDGRNELVAKYGSDAIVHWSTR
jgi:hypothetical protein